jgi:CheY-like chemotaxis protein
MTRKVLLVSNDKDFKDYINVATLTLTKLNHQITITDDKNDGHIDWMIVDMDTIAEENFEFLLATRKSELNQKLKIVCVLTSVTDEMRTRLFKSGCDSILTKKEFLAAANNILIF